MSDDTYSNGIERFISENEPVDQDVVVDEFGRRALVSLRELMIQNKVSYTLDWKLQSESDQ